VRIFRCELVALLATLLITLAQLRVLLPSGRLKMAWVHAKPNVALMIDLVIGRYLTNEVLVCHAVGLR
jgi:hypothetical protein